MDVALATAAALPGLVADDRILLRKLLDLGVTAEPVVWEDGYADWGSYRACVIRSAWDYAYRRGAFLDWARATAALTELWNPYPLVEWNTHKRYLVDLAARGVSVVPTVVLGGGKPVDLAGEMEQHGWTEAVLKAAVAQSGRFIRRVTPATRREGQAHLERLLPYEDMLLQPYVSTVMEGGELSLVFVEGEFTHAVRKRSAGGDLRVHDDYGGSVEVETPAADELAVATAALAATDHPMLYSRVDVVRGPAGRPMVMEYEVVEPELFFRFSEKAAARLAEAIRSRLA
jgi:hypothetical protein